MVSHEVEQDGNNVRGSCSNSCERKQFYAKMQKSAISSWIPNVEATSIQPDVILSCSGLFCDNVRSTAPLNGSNNEHGAFYYRCRAAAACLQLGSELRKNCTDLGWHASKDNLQCQPQLTELHESRLLGGLKMASPASKVNRWSTALSFGSKALSNVECNCQSKLATLTAPKLSNDELSDLFISGVYYPPARFRYGRKRECRDFTEPELSELLHGNLVVPESVDERIPKWLSKQGRKTLFCTDAGLVGLALHGISPGDSIAIVDETCLPAVLRPLWDHREKYEFRGYAYVPLLLNVPANELRKRNFDVLWP